MSPSPLPARDLQRVGSNYHAYVILVGLVPEISLRDSLVIIELTLSLTLSLGGGAVISSLFDT